MASLALDRVNAELQWITREFDAYSHGMVHDLRARLTRIGCFAGLLGEDLKSLALGEESVRKIRIITGEAERMAETIDALLRFSGLAHQRLVTRPVDMRALAESIATGMDRPVATEVRIAPLPGCEGDEALLSHVFTNLLGNAIKFSRGRERPLVEIGSSVVAGQVAYFVRDNGIGFDPKFAAELFGPFRRLHGPHDFEGVGLGLALVRRIVERHGGRTWAESTPDAGATFWFALGDEVRLREVRAA